MKNTFTNTRIALFFIIILLSSSCILNAQCPLGEEYGVNAQENIMYTIDTGYDGRIDTLYLDIYTPAGDDNPNRAMIVWIHGGGFFGGDRMSFRDICKEFAKRGYATATISYRLGFYSPSVADANPPFSYDKNEPVRAGYRSMQDTKSALRFLKARHLQDSTDIEHFFVAGASAGGIAALTAANIVNTEDKYPACGPISPVIVGDTAYDRPDLGPVSGKTNLNGYNSRVEGVISIFGGLVDVKFLGKNYPKHYFLYHQILDPIVPCETHNGYWLVPVVKDNYPKISGGCSIVDYLEENGSRGKVLMPYIVNGANHGVHDLNSLTDSIQVFLNTVLCSPSTATENIGAVPSIRVFPQPAQEEVAVELPEGINIETAVLYGLDGRRVVVLNPRTIPSEKGKTLFDISRISAGVYLLQLIDRGGQPHIVKLVIGA